MSLDPGSILWRATCFPLPLWVQSLEEPTFFSITLFFLPFFFPFLHFFFPLLFCPTLLFLPPPFPLPSFPFYFSYSFPIPFLHPHSFSYFLYFFFFVSFFPLFFLPLSAAFLLSLSSICYSPGCFLFSPSSLFLMFMLLFSFSPFNIFFLFLFISPLCQGGCYKIKIRLNKAKVVYHKNFSHLLALSPALPPIIHVFKSWGEHCNIYVKCYFLG